MSTARPFDDPRSSDDVAEPAPLSLREDVVRAFRGRPAPVGANGKPVIQPWAVGPGRIIGFVSAIVGVLAPLLFWPLGVGSGPLAIGFGLLGFVLSNTAWAHLRNAERPRTLPFAGQIIAGVAVLVGIVTLIVGSAIGG